MDNLTVNDQSRLFNNAEIIVGAHGSAFVNMVYCKQSCKVIELFGPGYTSGHDYSLAYVKELSWTYIEGIVDVNVVPTFVSDYYIEKKKLIEMVIRLIEEVKAL